ncbi:MAG: diaminopimelate decarboxylase [Candidatus Coatesbacteria bacterium]
MNDAFRNRRGSLHCESVSLDLLARRHGTPLWVYSGGAIRGAVAEVREAFAAHRPLICYSMKANSSLAILRLMVAEGCGIEVVSGGELFRALRAGAHPDRIVFSGVGKTDDEIRAGLRAGILMFNVESEPELDAIARVARGLGRRARVEFRINPHVDAHTHRYITTGTHENKFGIDWTMAEAVYVRAARLRCLEVAGIHIHIGSQITDPLPFAAALGRVEILLDRLERRGIVLRWRNIGGGLGIAYRPGQHRLNARHVASLLHHRLAARPMGLIVEPGRFLVGEAGALVTRVIHVKRGVRKNFAIVDAGMSDLIRPCLYEAHHEIVPVQPRSGAPRRVDIVGPICESSDFLGLGRRLPPLRGGDLLAVLGAGAYGMAMSSNYNGRRRAAEVLVEGGRAMLVRRRETYLDLVRNDR